MSIDLRQLIEKQEKELARSKPWFWEGNVQSALVNWLEAQGY